MADDPLAILDRIGRTDAEILDIAEAALALAALDRPQVEMERYRHHLASLCRDVQVRRRIGGGATGLDAAVQALNAVIVNQYGYRGDSETYDDLQNANLMRVIDRRKGLPVALGVLYLHAARAQGLMAMGLNFPGHFYIRLDMGGERVILDPFHGGAVREAAELRAQLKQASGGDAELRPQHYEAVGDKAVLIRLQNNIKMRLLRQGDLEGAARQLDRMLRLMPGNGALWLEAGMLNARLEKLGAAVEALQNCLDRSRDDIHRHQAAALLQRLKSKLN